ncbi:MAG: restriction endonuclease [Lachnospiraceae bacterium]|nr:restriction endonuclease [Lachnospiraceae bacterium]
MIPKYNEMYKEVLSVLSNGEELKYSEMVDKVACVLDLSQEDRNLMCDNSNVSVIYYRLGWTKTYLSKAGLVETVKRGIYKITNEGKNVLNQNCDITNNYLMKYPSFVEFVRPNVPNKTNNENERNVLSVDSETPDTQIEKAIELNDARVKSEILENIFLKSPLFFERLILDLLEKMGYAYNKESIIRTSYVGDEGIDGVIKEDKLGFSSIYVQAKRWKNPVGRPEIQKFLGAVAGQGGQKGLFITTSRFSSEAIDYASKQLQVKIILIDGERLADLMIKYGLGVSTIASYELKRIDIDYFESE